MKLQPEDFEVDEILGFEPSGDGEHVFLRIEKRGLDTEEVARMLACWADVPRSRIGYAGLKDRHALARQWFSVHLPGRVEPAGTEWPPPPADGSKGIRMLAQTRNRRKLKRGALAGNRFRIRVRGLDADRDRMEDILARIACRGHPNYFGLQRFGHAGRNLSRAEAFFSGRVATCSRHLRSLYLSAARALLFNQVLAARIRRNDWHTPLPGDWLVFDGSGAGFPADVPDAGVRARVEALQLHPSGPLWGRGGERATLVAGAVERQVVEAHPVFARGLENQAVKGMRRPLRVRARAFDWCWQRLELEMEFVLPAGAYATSLVRELIDTE